MSKNIFCCALILVTIFGCSNTRNIKINNPLDPAALQNIIDTPGFVFTPLYVHPISGRSRDLSTGFDISVSKDSIISYLPFFGRGYTAPISPADIDFDFTSTKFSYKVTQAKKGWMISIKPKDQRSLQELYFRIFDNASATLNITSIDRSSVSYDGYITERKKYIKTKR